MALAGVLRRGDARELQPAWWALREKYQGIAPPVARTEADFDPGAKYHIPGNTPYTRYFLSFILQFQFQKALCDAAGLKGPLHECSIYGNEDAGKRFGAMLAMGASKPWQDTLYELTGTRQMDASAILEYFAAAAGLAQGAEQGPDLRLVSAPEAPLLRICAGEAAISCGNSASG